MGSSLLTSLEESRGRDNEALIIVHRPLLTPNGGLIEGVMVVWSQPDSRWSASSSFKF